MMKLNYRIISTLEILLFIMVVPINADSTLPEGTIYGHVYDSDTNNPVSGAWVLCEGKTETTDAEGYYAIGGEFAPSATYVLTCYASGYSDSSESVKTDLDGKVKCDIYIQSGKSKDDTNVGRNIAPEISYLTVNAGKQTSNYVEVSISAKALDLDSDTVLYKFLLKGPSTGDMWQTIRDWDAQEELEYNLPYINEAGCYQIQVQIKDENHANYDDLKVVTYKYNISDYETEFEYIPTSLNSSGIIAKTDDYGKAEIDFFLGSEGLSNGNLGSAIEYNEIIEKVDIENPIVRREALTLAAEYPGECTIGQIASIYDYLKDRWAYVNDPRGLNYFNSASETLKLGENLDYVGVGDCDDFAILMSALIELIGGNTRIIYAYNQNAGHAYTEVYLGQIDNPDHQVENIIDWLKYKYNTDKVYAHINSSTHDVWLNLDWSAGYPGGPFYEAEQHTVLLEMDAEKKYPLSI